MESNDYYNLAEEYVLSEVFCSSHSWLNTD